MSYGAEKLRTFELRFHMMTEPFKRDAYASVAMILRDVAGEAAKARDRGDIHDIDGNLIGSWKMG